MALVATVFVLFILYASGVAFHYPRRPARPPPKVTLPRYGTFSGTYNPEMTVEKFLGIEYSIQPNGTNRFKPMLWPRDRPQSFVDVKGRDASQIGPRCPQGGGQNEKENCLVLNLFRPANYSFAKTSKKLPVLIFLHGGAFQSGYAGSFDGPMFIAKSKEPLIVATVQYRLGALGSLPSKLFEEEGLLNLGIQDQKMALHFLKEYVQHFGGDPNRITLGGQSAGAHSVGIHLFHKYDSEANSNLFQQVVISSGSPTARAFPNATHPIFQAHFKAFMKIVGCNETADNDVALNCLKEAPLGIISKAQNAVFQASKHNITWPWQPVSPGPLLEKRGSQSGADETFFKIPTLISSNTNEGRFFAPHDLTSGDEFLAFFENLARGLTDTDIIELNQLYPTPERAESPYIPPDNQPITIGRQFNRMSAAWGDYAYICAVQETARLLADAGASVYRARFNTPNSHYYTPEWQRGFVPHATDARYFNGAQDVEFSGVADLYHSYWVNFIVKGDPNNEWEYPTPNGLEMPPRWTRYEKLGGRLLNVRPTVKGGTVMEDEGVGIRMKECAWWNDPERMRRLNK